MVHGAARGTRPPHHRGTILARLILDATALVTAERGARRLKDLIEDEDDVAIAVVTAAELLKGVELADTRRRSAREAFASELLGAIVVEPYDLGVVPHHAALLAHVRRSGRPRGAHDLIIAATALARSRMVITADASGFRDLPGVRVEAIG